MARNSNEARRKELLKRLTAAQFQCDAAIDSISNLRTHLARLRTDRDALEKRIAERGAELRDAIADRNACTAEQRSIRAQLRNLERNAT